MYNHFDTSRGPLCVLSPKNRHQPHTTFSVDLDIQKGLVSTMDFTETGLLCIIEVHTSHCMPIDSYLRKQHLQH